MIQELSRIHSHACRIAENHHSRERCVSPTVALLIQSVRSLDSNSRHAEVTVDVDGKSVHVHGRHECTREEMEKIHHCMSRTIDEVRDRA